MNWQFVTWKVSSTFKRNNAEFEEMAMRIERIGDEDGVVSQRDSVPAERTNVGEIRHATVEEALAAYKATLPQHDAAHRELAKCDTTKTAI